MEFAFGSPEKWVKEVYEQVASLLSKRLDSANKERQIMVVQGEIRQGWLGLFEWGRGEEHDAPGWTGELVEQFFVSLHKVRQGSRSLERFHLPELGEDDGGA